jgi:hypothetical protein
MALSTMLLRGMDLAPRITALQVSTTSARPITCAFFSLKSVSYS